MWLVLIHHLFCWHIKSTCYIRLRFIDDHNFEFKSNAYFTGQWQAVVALLWWPYKFKPQVTKTIYIIIVLTTINKNAIACNQIKMSRTHPFLCKIFLTTQKTTSFNITLVFFCLNNLKNIHALKKVCCYGHTWIFRILMSSFLNMKWVDWRLKCIASWVAIRTFTCPYL
jgi:hypothetical protein